ncbi:MAG: hypothetical protein K2R98_28365 [Gemmataceae bacterium]|nr:hypothetical protein [Gemmataceae bacterium]
MKKSEIDTILERFDKTPARLQRRIIVKAILDRDRLLAACRAALGTALGTALTGAPTEDVSTELLRRAIAQADADFVTSPREAR